MAIQYIATYCSTKKTSPVILCLHAIVMYFNYLIPIFFSFQNIIYTEDSMARWISEKNLKSLNIFSWHILCNSFYCCLHQKFPNKMTEIQQWLSCKIKSTSGLIPKHDRWWRYDLAWVLVMWSHKIYLKGKKIMRDIAYMQQPYLHVEINITLS